MIFSFDPNIRKRARREGMQILESDHYMNGEHSPILHLPSSVPDKSSSITPRDIGLICSGMHGLLAYNRNDDAYYR